ncbi:unnamed protein product [Arctia plantaginis]|uniref:Uncharacterized protein n=1 Tax=Arctia plantaginis TaxID=874455 RepID=A0A8S1AAE1_ARCPL|nr:unnamed protein product [Arctia plantaginis]
MPNNKKHFVSQTTEHSQDNADKIVKAIDDVTDEDDNLGERELDYYLGVRKKENYWRDPMGREKIRKDYLVYHCGVTEDDYDKKYKKEIASRASYVIPPRLKQVPFKIHRKKRNGDLKDDSWRDKSGIFKLFAHRRDSEYSTSDSYSECDSNEDMKVSEIFRSNENDLEDIIDYLNELDTNSDDRYLEVCVIVK